MGLSFPTCNTKAVIVPPSVPAVTLGRGCCRTPEQQFTAPCGCGALPGLGPLFAYLCHPRSGPSGRPLGTNVPEPVSLQRDSERILQRGVVVSRYLVLPELSLGLREEPSFSAQASWEPRKAQSCVYTGDFPSVCPTHYTQHTSCGLGVCKGCRNKQ